MSSHSSQPKKLTESDAHPRWTDLTAFEGNVLYAVVRLQTDDETPYGLAVKSVLENIYDEEINHGRVYRALDDLAEYGLVKKSTLDKRTNEYKATDVGYDLIRRRASLLHDTLNKKE
ncbi:helix-turn-helix transcriptional regulator [Haloarcula sp. GH36]|uniref:helix-turn-helix transcriptional regulator n=1 Tax=Haloarcula montana TaxID=3111776 RepID=UPI002D786D62|nr:helix-turn-helix transcriptional regulator [Haloarcula sp. GH36]